MHKTMSKQSIGLMDAVGKEEGNAEGVAGEATGSIGVTMEDLISVVVSMMNRTSSRVNTNDV